MTKQYCVINMYVDTLDKILHLLQNYVETLDTYDEIEEIINIIHFLQEQMYYADKKEGSLSDKSQDAILKDNKGASEYDARKNES